jgi:hypothetical protein
MLQFRTADGTVVPDGEWTEDMKEHAWLLSLYRLVSSVHSGSFAEYATRLFGGGFAAPAVA